MQRLRQLLPSAEAIRANRWLRWLGPALHHPKLWHLSRRGMALGMALGFFFGLLIPLAQIPLSVAAAVALRANVPVAVATRVRHQNADFAFLVKPLPCESTTYAHFCGSFVVATA